MNDYHTLDELKDLCGWTQNAKIKQWLDTLRCPYASTKAGFPRVNKLALAKSLGAPVEVNIKEDHEPSFEKLHG